MRKLQLSAISRPVLLASIATILIVSAWSGWWWLAGHILRRSFDDWIATERQQGSEVRFGALVLSGFPLRVCATVSDLAIIRSDGSRWHGPEVMVEAPAWHITTLHMRLNGQHDWHLPAGSVTTIASTQGGEGWLTLGGAAGFTDLRAHLTGVVIIAEGEDAAATNVARLDLTISAPRQVPNKATDTGLMITIEVDKILMPPKWELPLGPTIESLALIARVMGLPPAFNQASLAGWSQAGGNIVIDSFNLHWGQLGLGAEGSLGLDQILQPIGALTTEVTGVGAAIDAMVATGWVKAKQGHTVKSVLTGLMPHGEGKALLPNPAIKLPLSLHDRYIHVGPFRLMQVPPVTWPIGPSPTGTGQLPAALNKV
ncbi:MAG: DUF2125 domain-containing protein [Rhodospirillaceae bacterium]